MDFTLTDDHIALRDAVRRFCDGEYPAHERGLPVSAETEAHRHAGLADLGLLGLALPAAHGGSELDAVASMLVATELGRTLAGADWLASAILAAPLIAEAGSPAQQDRWLADIVRGARRAALAFEEPHARWSAQDLRCSARVYDDTDIDADTDAHSWQLDGSKSGVLGGDTADLLLVLAQAPQGPTLFAVDSADAGLRRRPYRLIDGRGAAHLELAGVRAECLGTPGHAAPLVRSAFDRANAMLVADTTGATEMLLALTLEHLRTRRQFGQALAAFQALQHRVADLGIALEQLKSMSCVAALALAEADDSARTRAVAAAKVVSAQLGRRAAFDAIQLHGAMGMTEECAAARYAKRLLANGALFGDAMFHRQRFAALRTTTEGDLT